MLTLPFTSILPSTTKICHSKSSVHLDRRDMKLVTIAEETDITRESRGYKGIRRFNSTKLPASAGLLTQITSHFLWIH
ncbi:hypothetical protein F2P79_004083 [Pimephales promelas]|nr:hypothetical protein F2P79_004083 [Pimephales promelas]